MARPGLDKHVKFRRLVRMLGEPRPHVRGYLELLWEVGYENGDPVLGDQEAVEAAAEYPGEPGKLFQALLECGGKDRVGFVEEVSDEPGQFQIHDLFDHAPEYVKKRWGRELARQQRGQSLSEIRSQAGRKGAEATNSKKQASGKCPANGRHLPQNSGKRSANGHTPAPAPAPAPNEERESASADAPLDLSELIQAWNRIDGVQHCRSATKSRKTAFRERSKDPGWVSDLPAALERVAASSFCHGRNDRGWLADLDFFLRPDSVTKLLEGKYDDRNGNGQSITTGPAEATDEYAN